MLCIRIGHWKRVSHVLNCNTTGECVVRNPCVTTKKPVKVSRVCEGGFLDLRPRFKKRRPLSRFLTGWGVYGADEVLLISLLNNVS